MSRINLKNKNKTAFFFHIESVINLYIGKCSVSETRSNFEFLEGRKREFEDRSKPNELGTAS